MIGTWKAFMSLTPEQKEVLEHKSVKGEFTPRALIEMLQPIAAFDKKSDKTRMGAGCTALLLAGAAIFFVCGNPFGGVFSYVLAGITAGLSTVLFVMVAKLATRDLSNNFRLVALPFFAVLQEDMRAGETATINLDLSSPTSKEKLVRTAEPYEKGAYYKVVDSIYEDEWFDGSARLVDGSTLAWSIAEEVTVSKRTKRTSRGKHKTKTRTYKRVRMTVDLALPSKTYAVDPGAAGAATDAKVRAKEGEKRNTLHLSRRIKVRSENPIHPRVFLELIADAYRRARPAEGGAS
jgi:hypothetical protein